MPGTFQPHLFATSPLRLWWSLLREYGGVPPRYWGRLAGILATSAVTAPLRLAERLRFGRQVARTEISQPPIFIQGFARSGTTHLHNLMAHDPGLGYVSTFQAAAAPCFLISRGWLDRLIAGRLPSKRPMDNVAVSLDLPQEEELALAAASRLSSVHQLSFPGRAREIVAKMGAMHLTEAEMREWTDTYLHVLRKATLASDGRRLVLKTPANLGRTALLHSLFPGARFVFVVRNPYVVFSSTMKLYRTLIPMYRLQDVDWEVIEASVLSNYVDMTRRYLRDRASIPKGSLIEVRFEDVEADAMGVLERVYGALGLPGWEGARKPVAEYLESLAGYRKNRYRFDRSLIDKVDREWGFAVREWGYEPP
ncbi:MAG: sulfotransferase [Gemmatimonadaceae bacterium]|nr:sulfotransferase [Gemmatimonadaceae bacterium]